MAHAFRPWKRTRQGHRATDVQGTRRIFSTDHQCVTVAQRSATYWAEPAAGAVEGNYVQGLFGVLGGAFMMIEDVPSIFALQAMSLLSPSRERAACGEQSGRVRVVR